MRKSPIGLVVTTALLAAAPAPKRLEPPCRTKRRNTSVRRALRVGLEPTSSLHYVVAPERTPKAENPFGGVVTIQAPTRPGIHQVNLGEEAWMDVVQDGRAVPSTPFTRKMGCKAVRKSVRYEISPGPAIIQISGAGSLQ
jgi:hypothetical protein